MVKRGFTIVELLIVIVIIGILAVIAIVSYTGITNQANNAELQSGITQASQFLATYSVQNGSYPLNLAAAQAAGMNINSGDSPTYYATGSGSSYCLAVHNGTQYLSTMPGLGIQSDPCPVAWWAFDGDANDPVNGLNGTVNGATLTTGASGAPNTAYLFSGTSNYITFPGGTSPLNFTGTNFSVSFWAKINTVGTSTWYDVINGSTKDWGVGFTWTSASVPNFKITHTSYLDGPSMVTSFSLGAWHHFAITYQVVNATNATVTSYIDSSSIGSSNWTDSAFPFTPSSKIIGARQGASSGFFNGALDDVRAYNYALSAGEVKAIYQAGAQ